MRSRSTFATMLGALLALGSAGPALAEVGGTIEADVPFAFHAGDNVFPAGRYVVRSVDPTRQDVLEIRSEDGNHAGVVLVRRAEAETPPSKTEMIFDRYGDQYFLSRLFEGGSTDGDEVPISHDERLLQQRAQEPELHHVPARQVG